MANTIQSQVDKSGGWTEVGAGIAGGFFSASADCLYCIQDATPSLTYGHRISRSSGSINFTKTGSDKLYVWSDISDKAIVVITPA